jgi:hypothetical protein
MVKKGELQIWSLRIWDVQRIPARDYALAFLNHDQSTHEERTPSDKSLFI